MGEVSGGLKFLPPRLEKLSLLIPEQATSMDLKRVPRPMAPAIAWSRVGASKELACVGAMPVMIAALPDQCWKLGLSSNGTRMPLTRFNLLLKGLREANCGVISQSWPALLGKKSCLVRPQPQKYVPKRCGIFLPVAAKASPLVSSMQSRNGRATATE